ncbi:MAG: hypothetical protein KKF12_18085 [Proteobacteria bacterium]|nr:hypothetical protein [Desulfobacula sp.]MBU3952068.1 hypothetical protein [Pseudomonadota bacterium]MBU4132730.1 hypothetical protein [Pseudomonadota bacterium]
MTKFNTNYDPRAKQLSLPFKHSGSFDCPAGSFRRSEAVQEAVRSALKRCLLDRDEIAEEMSRLLGEKISSNHIANWAAESKNGWRLPLEYAAAFSAVTNDNRVIKAAFSGSGINVLDDKEMTYFEIGKAVEEKRESDIKLKETRSRLQTLRLRGDI